MRQEDWSRLGWGMDKASVCSTGSPSHRRLRVCKGEESLGEGVHGEFHLFSPCPGHMGRLLSSSPGGAPVGVPGRRSCRTGPFSACIPLGLLSTSQSVSSSLQSLVKATPGFQHLGACAPGKPPPGCACCSCWSLFFFTDMCRLNARRCISAALPQPSHLLFPLPGKPFPGLAIAQSFYYPAHSSFPQWPSVTFTLW